MKIIVIGTGYVGLVTGTCFAESGVTVICIDKDERKINRLNEGSVPIYEPGLEPLIRRNVENRRLFFSSSLKDNLDDAEVIFIAVGTPSGEDGSADLKHVLNVAEEIGTHINNYLLVVTKSTVPPGTSEKVRRAIQGQLDRRKSDVKFDVASNPEFLKEGAAVEDFLKPQRVVVGVANEKSGDLMKRLYAPFLLNNRPIIIMDIISAELTKYAANAMLATRISFINEIANLCDLLGADINNVRRGIGSDSRIGNRFLYPGTGYGGSCFPKDVKALIKTANDNDYDLKVIKAVEKANEHQKNVMFEKIMKFFNNKLNNKTLGIWGLSFKPKTDDIRESSSIYLIQKLLNEGVVVKAYDPAAMEETRKKLNDKISYSDNPYDAINNADALVLMTEWSEFHLPDLNKMADIMKGKVIFDGRNIYDPVVIKKEGFEYFGIGRR